MSYAHDLYVPDSAIRVLLDNAEKAAAAREQRFAGAAQKMQRLTEQRVQRELAPRLLSDIVEFVSGPFFQDSEAAAAWIRRSIEDTIWKDVLSKPTPVYDDPWVSQAGVTWKAARKLSTWINRHMGLLIAGFKMSATAVIENGLIVNFIIRLHLSRVLASLMVDAQRALLSLRALIRKLEDTLRPPPWREAEATFRVQRRSDIGILRGIAIRRSCQLFLKDAQWIRSISPTPLTTI